MDLVQVKCEFQTDDVTQHFEILDYSDEDETLQENHRPLADDFLVVWSDDFLVVLTSINLL